VVNNQPGIIVCLAAALALASVATAGTKPAAPDSTVAADEKTSRTWLTEPRLQFLGFTWLPRVYYSQETGVGIGGHLLRPFNWGGGDTAGKNSEFRLKGRVTYKRQWSLEGRLRLGWSDRKWSFNTKFGAETIPGRFYGVGPDTPAENREVYEPLRMLGYVEVMRRVLPGMRLGLRGEFERLELQEVEPGGLLEQGGVPGSEGGNVIGYGVIWDYDSRDRIYSPRSGSFHQAFALRFDDGGSDFDFDVYNVDLRKYFSVATGHVVALQGFAYVSRGTPPFWRYAALGGRAHSRGYYKGRYLDHTLLSWQVEYRPDIWRRLGAAVFAGFSDVGRGISDIELLDMKPTVGLGTRIRLGGRDGVKAQIDVAFGRDDIRFYMSLDEAF
jgi:hypothetical protein